MSQSNYTRNILNIKDENIIFGENFLNEEKINGSTTKVFHGKLTYTPSHCPKCGCVYDIEQDNIIKYGLKKNCKIKIDKVSGFKALLLLDKQRFYCKDCHSTFIATTNLVDFHKQISNNTRLSITLDLMRKGSEKDIAYSFQPKCRIDGYYIGDTMKLRQVLINILGNAVKFTDEGGKIEFLVGEIRRCEGKAVMQFVISDNGIGMSEDYLPHIFDAFSQENASFHSKHGSTGIGMPITKSIVELMNGTIEVESEKGKGTTFTVTVTLGISDRQAEEKASDTAANKSPVELKGRRILLAEDVSVNAEIIVMMLKMHMIEVDVAENGRIAVEKFTGQPEGFYDAILMDMRMPEMDGLEAARLIRSCERDDAETVPIIALTANAFEEDVQKSIQAGLNAHLSKPVEPEVLFETLETLINQHHKGEIIC